eukprot:2858704-Pleurochrysis_carterae.AAC.1
MVNTPTQRGPLLITSSFGPINPNWDAEYGLIHRIRTGIQFHPRLRHLHTPKRASWSGRTPKATVPSGTEADDGFSHCRPRSLSPNWEEERRGPDLL